MCKISNPSKKITTKNSIIFGQVWIGEIGNKEAKMLKEQKRNSKLWNFLEILVFKYLKIFFNKKQ